MLPAQVLIVDDSAVVRKLVTTALAGHPEINVVGTASNGSIALARIPQLNPDVVTLDINMPEMDGLQALVEIRKLYPRLPVIMFSVLTETGAAATIQALAAGASDYLTKPNTPESMTAAMEQIEQELTAKILCLTGREMSSPAVAGPQIRLQERRWPGVQSVEVLAIGCSTGGPTALSEVLRHLPANLPVPVVIVQHMPPLFTRFLAERLSAESPLKVWEAEQGQKLSAGEAYIAPGDYHMTVARRGTERVVELNQEPPENSCRPAVDVLFRSVASVYRAGALAVVLTGMGTDGARGAAHIREAGGEVIVQDKESSVVWGMPGAVVEAGVADTICPLAELGPEILRRVKAGRARTAVASA